MNGAHAADTGKEKRNPMLSWTELNRSPIVYHRTAPSRGFWKEVGWCALAFGLVFVFVLVMGLVAR